MAALVSADRTGSAMPSNRRTCAPWLLLVTLAIAISPGAFAAASEIAETSTAPPQKYYVEDIKAAMLDYIAAQVDADGVFHLRDDRTGELLELEFVKIHDPVRQIDGSTYFACTDFRVVDAPDRLYDLDFWMRPSGGQLEIYAEKVHKEPRHSIIYGWYKQPRYTFVDDHIVSLY